MKLVENDTEAFTAPHRGLWTQIREDWDTHDRDWSLAGFRALAVYRLGVWRMNIRSGWLRKPVSLVYNFLFRYVRNHYGIELPYTARIGRRVLIAHQGTIVLHERAEVGDDCIIRHGVTLGAPSHRRSHDAPRLGRGVHVGAGAMILGKITIGDYAAIGANAVVTNDVPAQAKVLAAPSQIIPIHQDDSIECDSANCRLRSTTGVSASISVMIVLLNHWQRHELNNFADTASQMASFV